MQFRYLILTKISTFVATIRCQILRQKCIHLISAKALPQTALGELTALLQTL